MAVWRYGTSCLSPGFSLAFLPAFQARAPEASCISLGRPALGRVRPVPGPRLDPQAFTARWTRAKEAGQPWLAPLPTVPASSLLRSLLMLFLWILSCFGVSLAQRLLGPPPRYLSFRNSQSVITAK